MLDENEWSEAREITKYYESLPYTLNDASGTQKVLVLEDENGIYFGFISYQDIDSIRAQKHQRDEEMANADMVGVSIDFDGDGLNNYFENTTGCPLIYGIENGNMSLDNYTTLWNNSDTDNGGVIDYQEYLDGTNPQNNPDDDLNPLDTDGDGIP